MSNCISTAGEYSEHMAGPDGYCTRCLVLDEGALRQIVRRQVADEIAKSVRRSMFGAAKHHDDWADGYDAGSWYAIEECKRIGDVAS